MEQSNRDRGIEMEESDRDDEESDRDGNNRDKEGKR